MKILISGGHLAPVLSVISLLPKDTKVLIAGRKFTFEGDRNPSFEYIVAKKLGIPFVSITTGRLQRTFTRHTFGSLLKIPAGIVQSLFSVKKYKPDVFLSFGGYVSFPVTIACWFLGVPIIVHEQTLSGGIANRIASHFAKKVLISFETSRKYFPKNKTILTGNPVRKSHIGEIPFTISKDKLPLLYITGGSAGSHTINEAVYGCLDRFLEEFRIIHQTGDSWEFMDFERLKKKAASLSSQMQKRYYLTKFINPFYIGSILPHVDIVISRSGINTLTELMYFGKPALLIPLNSEQMENAQLFKTVGLGDILPQKNISSETLYKAVSGILKNLERYNKSKQKAREYLKLDAAERIIHEVNAVVGRQEL